MKLVITGGHHSSALPIIKKLQSSNSKNDSKGNNANNVEIHWIGHKYTLQGNKNSTLEYNEITELGIPFYNLYAGKFYKTYNLLRLLKIPLGFIHAFFLLLKIRPDVILSFGGYLAVPVVIVGKFLGIKSLTHEQTLVTGYANSLISKYASKVLISWPQSAKYFPDSKVVYTGIPIRESIFKTKSTSFKINKELPTIYITGGKTGSHVLNTNISEILGDLLEIANVIHQCGDHSELNDFDMLERLSKKYSDKSGVYTVRKFITNDEIGSVFSACDLVISRAGAHIISELIILEKPALLIPISWVSHNEQLINAQLVKDCGLGEIIEESSLQPQYLLNKIKDMFSNLKQYKLNDKKLKEELLKDSTSLIIDEIFNLYKTQNKN